MTLAKSLPRIHPLEMELLMKDLGTLAKNLLRICPPPDSRPITTSHERLRRTSGESFPRIPLPGVCSFC